MATGSIETTSLSATTGDDRRTGEMITGFDTGVVGFVILDVARFNVGMRVGLEEALWEGPGQLATSNAAQVKRVRSIIEGLSLAARAPGQTIVLRPEHPAWVQIVGFLVQAERSGVNACLDDPSLTFIVTKQFTCSPAQVAGGRAYWFSPQQDLPPGSPVILRFSHVAVAAPR